jgi:hypothetical protein
MTGCGGVRDLLVCAEGQITVRLHFDPEGRERRRLGASPRLLRRQWDEPITGEEIGQRRIFRKQDGDIHRLVAEDSTMKVPLS